jgi:hypothetical protein
MQGVKGTHRNREWLQRAREHNWYQLEQRDTADQSAYLVTMRAPESTGVNLIPNLIFKQAA